jgi:hypothetical protein
MRLLGRVFWGTFYLVGGVGFTIATVAFFSGSPIGTMPQASGGAPAARATMGLLGLLLPYLLPFLALGSFYLAYSYLVRSKAPRD